MANPYGKISTSLGSRTRLKHTENKLKQDLSDARDITQTLNELTSSQTLKIMRETLDENTPDAIENKYNESLLREKLSATDFGKEFLK